MQDIAYNWLMAAAGTVAAHARSLEGTVFCFHSVTDPNATERPSSLSVSAEFLRLFINRLRGLGIPIVSIDEALARKRSGKRSCFAALTFDDGYLDNGQILDPLMQQEQVPYTIFVTSALAAGTLPLWWDTLERLVHGQDVMVIDGQAVPLGGDQKANVFDRLSGMFKARDPAGQCRLLSRIGHANPIVDTFKPYGSCLSWDMLRALNASPIVTIGAHTRHHPVLAQLDADAIRHELTNSKEEIADQLGCAIDYLAYPFGQPFEYGEDAPVVAEQVGYKAAFTTCHGDWFGRDAGLFTLPRVLIANKARHPAIPLAYMSPWPRRIKTLVRHVA